MPLNTQLRKVQEAAPAQALALTRALAPARVLAPARHGQSAHPTQSETHAYITVFYIHVALRMLQSPHGNHLLSRHFGSQAVLLQLITLEQQIIIPELIPAATQDQAQKPIIRETIHIIR